MQAYLIGLARNQLRRQLKEMRRRVDHVELDDELCDSAGEHLVDELSRNQELTALRKAILSLPPAYREIVILCNLESIDYAEAAAQLGCRSERCVPGCIEPAPFCKQNYADRRNGKRAEDAWHERSS